MKLDEAIRILQYEGEFSLSGQGLTALTIVLRSLECFAPDHGLVEYPTPAGNVQGQIFRKMVRHGRTVYLIERQINGDWVEVVLQPDQFRRLEVIP